MPSSRRKKGRKAARPAIVHISDVDGKRSLTVDGKQLAVTSFEVRGDADDPLVHVSLVLAAPDVEIEYDDEAMHVTEITTPEEAPPPPE